MEKTFTEMSAKLTEATNVLLKVYDAIFYGQGEVDTYKLLYAIDDVYNVERKLFQMGLGN